MPGDSFKLAQAGQPLDIPAAAWNALVASLRRPGRQGAGDGGGGGGLAPGEVYVQNNSGASLDRFAILGVDGPLLDPAADADRFAERPGLTGMKPTADHEDGRFAVLAEPVPSGSVGLAIAGGVSICKVNVTDAAHKFAKAKADTTDALVSTDAGPCVVLWKQSGTGNGKWAVVRFGGGGAKSPVRWGKLATAWSPGQATVTLTKTDSTGTALTGPDAGSAVVVIQMPGDQPPLGFGNEVNDLLPYAEDGDKRFLLSYRPFIESPAGQYNYLGNLSATSGSPNFIPMPLKAAL